MNLQENLVKVANIWVSWVFFPLDAMLGKTKKKNQIRAWPH